MLFSFRGSIVGVGYMLWCLISICNGSIVDITPKMEEFAKKQSLNNNFNHPDVEKRLGLGLGALGRHFQRNSATYVKYGKVGSGVATTTCAITNGYNHENVKVQTGCYVVTGVTGMITAGGGMLEGTTTRTNRPQHNSMTLHYDPHKSLWQKLKEIGGSSGGARTIFDMNHYGPITQAQTNSTFQNMVTQLYLDHQAGFTYDNDHQQTNGLNTRQSDCPQDTKSQTNVGQGLGINCNEDDVKTHRALFTFVASPGASQHLNEWKNDYVVGDANDNGLTSLWGEAKENINIGSNVICGCAENRGVVVGLFAYQLYLGQDQDSVGPQCGFNMDADIGQGCSNVW